MQLQQSIEKLLQHASCVEKAFDTKLILGVRARRSRKQIYIIFTYLLAPSLSLFWGGVSSLISAYNLP